MDATHIRPPCIKHHRRNKGRSLVISMVHSTASRTYVRMPCIAMLSIALVVCQFGCTVRVSHTVTNEEITNDSAQAFDELDKVKAVFLKTGERIEFEKPGGFYSPNARAIVGTTVDGEKVTIDLSDIESVQVSRVSKGRSEAGELVTVLLITGGILLVVFVIVAAVGLANEDL